MMIEKLGFFFFEWSALFLTILVVMYPGFIKWKEEV